MSDTIALLRANPGLAVIGALIVLASLVFGLVAVLMVRSGASLRPIAFIAGFFAIVVLPQGLFHASQAFGWIPKRDLTWTFGKDADTGARPARYRVREERLSAKDGVFTNPAAVFGPEADASLTVDLRARMPDGPFAAARAAQMAITGGGGGAGGSVVVAHFDRASDAERAAEQYAAVMLGSLPPVGADGARTVVRTSDVVKLLVANTTVLAWSGADDAAATQAMRDSPLLERVDSAPSAAARDAQQFWLYRPAVLIAITLLLLVAATAWFFRMSAWASEVPAAAGASPVDAPTLRQRLLSVNAHDVPFTIAADPDDTTRLVATWKYADAKWVDLARARGLRRTYRMILALDEATHTVRPIDQTSSYDWSAGVGGADLRWETQRGIIFFQQDRGRVFGLQLDAQGRFTPALSYTYRFDVREIKSPLIQAVTHAGWRWRPTLLHGPRWLGWLID